MAKSIVMNRMIVGGGSSGGGEIRLMPATALPVIVPERTICIVSDETLNEILVQSEEPNHAEGLAWIQTDGVDPEIIGIEGDMAFRLLGAWVSTGSDWAQLDAYHSATGEWVQFSLSRFSIADYTYTGNSELIDEGNDNWQIKFLTSGVLTLRKRLNVDAFLVGGGGGARNGGGGGGYTKTFHATTLQAGFQYPIIVGAGGAGLTAIGMIEGTNGGYSEFVDASMRADGGFYPFVHYGGAGGSGGGAYTSSSTIAGNGGSNGANGVGVGSVTGGTGQNSTTRPFGESTGITYAAGGGGGGGVGGFLKGVGGQVGGGNGGGTDVQKDAAPNTGSGGGGGTGQGQYVQSNGGKGGSGIVIIRNAREVA